MHSQHCLANWSESNAQLHIQGAQPYLHAFLKLVSLLVKHQRKLLSDFCCLSICQLLGSLAQQWRSLSQQLQLLTQLLHELLHLQAPAATLISGVLP